MFGELSGYMAHPTYITNYHTSPDASPSEKAFLDNPDHAGYQLSAKESPVNGTRSKRITQPSPAWFLNSTGVVWEHGSYFKALQELVKASQ